MDLALNNLQRLICHKTQTTNQTKRFFFFPFIGRFSFDRPMINSSLKAIYVVFRKDQKKRKSLRTKSIKNLSQQKERQYHFLFIKI